MRRSPAATALPLCSGLTELFFSDLQEDHAAAAEVCNACYFQDRCLDRALDRGEVFGVWGGLSFGDQRKVPKGLRIR